MKRQLTGKGLILISILVLFCVSTWAQDTEESSGVTDTQVFNLGQVVVQGKGETITQVTTVDVVDKTKIDLIGTDNVTEAIESVAGVNISEGSKGAKNFTVRGFNQRYVPMFLDGVPIYLPYEGSVDGGEIPTGNLSQITVTKGIASVLYGPNTMGGVINIVTLKPTKPFQGNYKATIDNDGRNSTNLNLGSRLNKYYYTLNFGYKEADDYTLSKDFEPTPIIPDHVMPNSDYSQYTVSLKAGFAPKEGQEYALGYSMINDDKGLPLNAYSTRYWRYTEWEKQTFYFIGDTNLTEKLLLKTRIFHDEYFNILDSYNDNTFTSQTKGYAFHSTYDDHSDGLSLVLRSKYLDKHTLSGSFYYKNDIHTEQDNINALWERYEAANISYGLEDDIKFSENFSGVIGASYDIQEPKYANGGFVRDDETAFNPQAGINWNVQKDTRLHLGVAKKSRFPTLFELYSGQFGGNLLNPDLATEKAVNYETGIEQSLPGDTVVGLNVFRSHVEDLIVRVRIGMQNQYQNIGQAKYQGVEFNLKTGYLKNNIFELNYTYLDAKDQSANRVSDHLPDAPQNKLYITDLYKLNDTFSLFGKLQFSSGKWWQDSNGTWYPLDGYWTADTKLIAALSPKATLELGVRNMFDEDYQNSYGYPREGRTFFLAVKGTF